MSRFAIYGDYIFYDDEIVENAYLLVFDKVILGITKNKNEISEEFEIIDKTGHMIFPGFINTHTHLPMVYFRGLADDLPLKEWLENHIWPAETKWLDEEFVYDATLLASIELIKSGTVYANDMYFYSDSIVNALVKIGLKGTVGAGVLDFPTKFAKNCNEYLNKAQSLVDKYRNNDLVNIAICPHAPYTVSPENYKKCVEFARKNNIIIHTHLAETEWEVNEIYKRYSMTPLKLMDSVGMLEANSVFAHMVHLTDEEIKIAGGKQVNVSHCIESNFKLASGFARIKELNDFGANITIGTDGAASNNDLDILAEASTVAKFHKAYSKDATVLSAKEILSALTINGARALNLSKCGKIKEGFSADFIIIDTNKPHIQPLYNPVSQLIYSVKSSDITDVFINGKHVLKNRQITTIDENEVLEKAKYWAKKIKNEG